MAREYLWAAVGGLVVAVVGVVLLYLGVSGALPKGFGLFDQSQWGVRAVSFIILLAVAIGLYFAYRGSSRKA